MKTNGGAGVWFICAALGEMFYWSYSSIPSHPVSLAIPLWIIDVTTMSPSLPLPPQPPPVPHTPALCKYLRAWLSLPRTGCTRSQWQYPIKRSRGEGRDAPWHLNQWLSYNNSMIFNLSLLPPSLQTPRQLGCFFFFSREERKKKISSGYLFWCFKPDGKNGALILKQPNAVMPLVLKFKWGDLAVAVSCLLMLHPKISICKQCV